LRRQNANCVRIATVSNFEPTSAVEIGDASGHRAVQVVEHEADITVDVPVERERAGTLPSTGDAGRRK